MITDLDQYGNMTIRFSTPMKTYHFNKTDINSSICDIYVKPSNDWHKNKENFNISTLNFTWNITHFEKDKMVVKLIFNNPEEISPLIEQDKIVFHILEIKHFFISETHLEDLS